MASTIKLFSSIGVGSMFSIIVSTHSLEGMLRAELSSLDVKVLGCFKRVRINLKVIRLLKITSLRRQSQKKAVVGKEWV